MRGEDSWSGALFSYIDLEERVPEDHPLRLIREVVNDVLLGLSADFAAVYSHKGRPSIAPEKLLRALLLQAFYSIRSERQLMEQLDFNLLYRWFVGLGVDEAVWDATVFCKNRDRLLEAEISGKFLSGVIAHERVRGLLSRDHFSVDGTLIEAWASMKSFRAKEAGGSGEDDGPLGPERNAERDFRGQRRKNETHVSTTDPDARLYRKGRGKESKLCFMGHALMENRNGLVVGALVTRTSGMAEREAALDLVDGQVPRAGATLGADKAYDVWRFKQALKERGLVPHMARRSEVGWGGYPIPTPPGYDLSQRHRKRIEEVFGWVKTIAGQAKTRFRGQPRVEASFTFATAAYNLIRLPRLLAQAPP